MSRSKAGSSQGSGHSRGRSRTSRRCTSGDKGEKALTRYALPPKSSRDYSIVEVENENNDGDEIESYWGDELLENWTRTGNHGRVAQRPSYSSASSSSSYRSSPQQQQRRPAQPPDLLAGLPPSDWFVTRPQQPAALTRSLSYHPDRTSQASSSYGSERLRYEVNCGTCGRTGSVDEIFWAPMINRSDSAASRQSYDGEGRWMAVGYDTRVIAPDYAQGRYD